MKMNQNDIVSINVIDRVLVANLDAELNETILLGVQKHILERFHAEPILGVVIDLSEVVILDTFIVSKVINIVESVEFMGGRAIITGLRPEAVITMVSLDLDLDHVTTALNVDQGIKTIKGLGVVKEVIEDTEIEENSNDEENEVQDSVHE